MASTSSNDIKDAIVAAGFEVYRTRGDEVQVAERVRENLILDSGVAVNGQNGLRVRLVVRAQRSDFPAEASAELFERARQLAASAVARGFVETATSTNAMNDPTDATRTLDTWYEVAFEKAVADLAQAMDEVRFAMALEKAAESGPPPV